jgi:Domain of unknown function (DUF4926)
MMETRKSRSMFNLYDTFRLRKPLPDVAIPVGSVGVVLMVFDGPRPAYEVEFPDGEGGNLGREITFTIDEDFMDSDKGGDVRLGEKE